ncbi:gas vesicle protein GvpG [Micromonospora sp. WMMD812]|uniref:gas vesicle protein GvpG n=1 Tax=Micromonospora sp. WMMD812 TaxID=3015152 RepID=UPI00248BB0E0|nr:gas vesicle protein GvpG [Micromonospora sp. WMMD812]WBB66137.1 gas vesicle protein GvpG [Micromonospora sp. WMMD812]
MDILWSLLTLPYAPMRGLTAVVKVIAREAESQLYNPANIRRELEELDAAAAAGELTAEERDARQQQVLDRLTGGHHPAPAAGRREPGPASRAGGAGRGAPVVRRNAPARRRGGQAGRRGDAAGSRAGSARSGPVRGRRTESERRRDGGGGVRNGGSDPRRPGAPA